MSEPIGQFCLVLHSHMPYVMKHGQAPHGEAWLYEAMANVYLPLLDLIGEVALHRVHPGLTIGLTPVLLEQLIHPYVQAGFREYLDYRIERAINDHAEFDRAGQPAMARLAQDWERLYRGRREHFDRIAGNIAGEFAKRAAEGHIELLTGCATHAYLPLLRLDACVRAQLAAGQATTRQVLGRASSGIWLPECAYRPSNSHWQPPVLDRATTARAGIETSLSAVGVDHFFIEAHLLDKSQPLGKTTAGHFNATGSAQAFWDAPGQWTNPLEPVGVASAPEGADVFAFARHPSVSEQVWSSTAGYPGDGAYLEFHKKSSRDGLRYWRVTDVAANSDHKHLYEAQAAQGRVHAHAQHFCSLVTEALQSHHRNTGRPGVCVATFDAELFGHWWFEGPRFLRDVLFTLAAAGQVKSVTSSQALTHRPEKVVRLAEGSWGEGGDHRVWLNDKTRWMWEIEHRAEMRFVRSLAKMESTPGSVLHEALCCAGRELLLLQASDWPFIVNNNSATDYAIQRFSLHATRFDRALAIANTLSTGDAITPIQQNEFDEMKLHDTIFADIDLNWWRET